jgi:hypothetical protein
MRNSLTLPLVALCFVAGVTDLSMVEAFSVPSQSTLSQRSIHATYPLFQLKANQAENNGQSSSLFQGIPGIRAVSPKRWPIRTSRWAGKMRRSLAVLCTAMVFWFGAAGLRTPPSHASTAVTPAAAQSRNILSASLEQVVDRYVKDHMFDDDAYDPVESVYREAVDDKIKGSHPKALSEITSSILGQDGIKADKQSSSNGIGGVMLNGINFLQKRLGISESMAIIVLTGSFVVAGPLAFIVTSMMVLGKSKRQFGNVMKQRYGDTYT